MVAGEKASFGQKLLVAMQKKKAEAGEGQVAAGRRAKAVHKAPLQATHSWLCSLQSSMTDSLSHGLEKYQNKKRRRPYNDDFDAGEVDDESYLTMCMDEEQKQLAGYYFLERKMDLNCFRIMPPLHRRHNDLMNSLARANCYEVVALSVLQRNISYGPYNHGGNLQTLWETGLAMMKQLNPDDSFLCKLWPRICRDRGWTTEEQCGRQARTPLRLGPGLANLRYQPF